MATCIGIINISTAAQFMGYVVLGALGQLLILALAFYLHKKQNKL